MMKLQIHLLAMYYGLVNMILEIYDIECLCNLFTYTGYDPKKDKYYQFVICGWRNDYQALVNHLKRDTLIQVG